jgi:DNA-directed RNA polymerase sigma subunit (sigma70/sigma32)
MVVDAPTTTQDEDLLLASLATDPLVITRTVPHSGATPGNSGAQSSIRDLLLRLERGQYRVLELLFGLDGRGPLPAAAVAAQLGITRQQVDRRYREALRSLRSVPSAAA